MRIQICGAGVAGTYLYFLLSGFDVYIKDVRRKPDCRCAWGVTYSEAKELYRKIGLDLDEYVVSRPECIVANGFRIKNKNVVIFDKKKLLEDLWGQIEFRDIRADLYVDATGHNRALLPEIDKDRLYPTLQTVEEHNAEENIYVYARKTGYAWAFPLGGSKWHVGAGDTTEMRAIELIKMLRQEYGFKEGDRICGCRAKIRLLPPSKCRPFVSGNIVGVGESIGCVSGFGEGNVPALESARILYECLVDNELHKYESRVLENFQWIEEEYKFVEAVQKDKKLTALLELPKVLSIERRSIESPVRDIRCLIKMLKH